MQLRNGRPSKSGSKDRTINSPDDLPRRQAPPEGRKGPIDRRAPRSNCDKLPTANFSKTAPIFGMVYIVSIFDALKNIRSLVLLPSVRRFCLDAFSQLTPRANAVTFAPDSPVDVHCRRVVSLNDRTFREDETFKASSSNKPDPFA